MKRINAMLVLIVLSAFALSGCVVRTYKVTKDRVDQDLTSGNKGYLQGHAPAEEAIDRKSTRTTQVVEVEFHSPLKFEKSPKVKTQQPTAYIKEPAEEEGWGNRGYISESISPQISQVEPTEKYKVQKNDTLQKISQKFYGTTKKWTKIYDANRGILKAPDKIYPGQMIEIPLEGMVSQDIKETQGKIK